MIDWNRVHDLRDEIGDDEFAEVVELFLDEVEIEIAALRGKVPLDTLESRLHFLKGSALNLGFAQFCDMCQAGETTASGGAAEQVDIGNILASYDASKMVFLKGLKDMKAA